MDFPPFVLIGYSTVVRCCTRHARILKPGQTALTGSPRDAERGMEKEPGRHGFSLSDRASLPRGFFYLSAGAFARLPSRDLGTRLPERSFIHRLPDKIFNGGPAILTERSCSSPASWWPISASPRLSFDYSIYLPDPANSRKPPRYFHRGSYYSQSSSRTPTIFLDIPGCPTAWRRPTARPAA